MQLHRKAIICVPLLFAGCAPYHISTDSLINQLATASRVDKITVIGGILPISIGGEVTGNDLKEIKCQDRKNRDHFIPVRFYTAIKVTKKDKHKCTFYLNSLIIHDSIMEGSKTNILNAQPINPIKLGDIAKIQLRE